MGIRKSIFSPTPTKPRRVYPHHGYAKHDEFTPKGGLALNVKRLVRLAGNQIEKMN